jgi:cardiolipin synthase A/B
MHHRGFACALMLTVAGCTGAPPVALGPGASQDPLQQQLALDATLGGTKPVSGNKVTVLPDGRTAFVAMFAAMQAAHDSIDLEYYTFENVRSGNLSLGDLLTRKLRQGVTVNIIYDGYGSLPVEPEFLAQLKAAGAHLLHYHPLDAAAGLTLTNPNDRDHRKIMVVDGRVAFVGGVNLDHVYENPPDAGATAAQDTKTAYWRDAAARVDGPAVADLQRLFMETWQHEHGETLPERDYFPPLAPAGEQVVQIIGSTPSNDRPLYYVALLNAIHVARHSIGISTGFFVPTHQAREELLKAARRGVQVRLIVPTVSDSADALAAGRASYGDLLGAGVQIYEIRGAVLHAKLAIVDGAWTVIGSSNFDRRSVVFNNEVDALVLGHETADAVSAVLDADVAHSKAIDLTAWEHRSWKERRQEFQARFMEWLL